MQNTGTGGAGGTTSTSNSTTTTISSGGPSDGIEATWSIRLGDANPQEVTDIAIATTGTIFVVGTFLGSIDCGPAGTLTATDDYDAFILALDPNGSPLWARALGGTGPDKANTVIASGPNGLYIAGEHTGALNIESGTLTSAGGLDAFLIKLNPDTGAALWGVSLGDNKDQRINALVRNTTTGNIFATGDFDGTLDIGAMAVMSVGNNDAFAIEYSATGDPVLALSFGDSAIQTATAIALGLQNEVYIAGAFDGKITLSGQSQTSAGGLDAFLGKIAPGGLNPWLTRFGDSTYQKPNALSPAPNGSQLIAGAFKGGFDAFGTFIQSSGGRDILLASINPAGKADWIRTLGDADAMATPDDQEALDIISDNSGNAYITGYVRGTADLGNGPVQGANDTDFFLLALDPTGTPQWSTRRGSTDTQTGQAIALDPEGNIIVAGHFRGNLTLTTETMVSAGSNDIFLAKFPAKP